MKEETLNTPEFKSWLVRIAHKIKSNTSNPQIIKFGDKYFKIKELG